MKILEHWTPAAFCGLLSFFALLGVVHPGSGGWWEPAFFSFLPMCFFFVASVTYRPDRELRELRQHVADVARRNAN